MHVILNAKERNKAFFVFSVFFSVTMLLVIMAIYFNFRIPVKHGEYLKEQLYQQQAENRSEENFAVMACAFKNKIDSADKNNTAVFPDITELNNLNGRLEGQKSLSPSVATMNNTIITALNELEAAKIKIRELEIKTAKMDALEDKLDKCQGHLDGYREKAENAAGKP